ncbi:MAG TPA: hypothetical protein VFX49_11680 [Chloroflexota bacterium]|nr:hypothetical protein [Chloroflexota bacterium]
MDTRNWVFDGTIWRPMLGTSAGAISTATAPAATGTRSDVADANADTLILAANAARRGATVYNDSTATLYLLVAAGAASATNFTVRLTSQAYFEVPFGYTGAIRGFWDADTAGSARVTEYT